MQASRPAGFAGRGSCDRGYVADLFPGLATYDAVMTALDACSGN